MVVDAKIGLLAREIERGSEASPHTMAIRAGLTYDAIEKVEEARTLLAELSEKLALLQKEQLERL